MKKRKLGKTGLKPTEIGFGCWAIGGHGYGATDDKESLEALESAWEKGVNFYDTADTYGFGHSEELVGKFLKAKPRDEIIIASKVGWDFYGEDGSKKNFTPEYIFEACEKSLKRLGVDCIDVYQLHNPTPEQIEEGSAIDALEKLKKEGKIRFSGVSIHTERDAKACFENGKVDTLQLILNILEQGLSETVFPKAKELGVGLIVREPLACGLLTAKYDDQHEFEKNDHRRRWVPEKRKDDTEKIAQIQKVLATDRMSLTQAAIEFVLDFEEVSTVIPGAKTSKQVLENLAASLDPELRSQESHKLKDLFHRGFKGE